jgi:uncharacterized membrane protein YoaK (UPF0700 family)
VLECLIGKMKGVQNKCWNDMREHPVTSLMVPGTLSSALKWLESENYSCCFHTEVKHEWRYTCTHLYAFMACAGKTLP